MWLPILFTSKKLYRSILEGVKKLERKYMENLSTRLVDKSIEAFIMGLEIYNKPTIKYRIEGFSFFICNAWELMLKAEMLNRNQSNLF